MGRERTKKFSLDLPLAEFEEIDRVIKKTNLSRRDWLLKVVRLTDNPSKSVSVENAGELPKDAQEQINVAYQEISDAYLDLGAELLKIDRCKAVEYLSKALSLKNGGQESLSDLV